MQIVCGITINELVRLLPGVNLQYDIDLNYDEKQRDYDNSNRRDKSHVSKLISLLTQRGVGSYKKKELREELGINDPTAFTKILNHNDFVDYCNRNNIDVTHHAIVVKKVGG